MRENQARKFTTSKKVNIDLCLPDFNATKIITWKLHVKESTNSIYNITLSKDLLIALELDINFSEDVIIGGEGLYEGWSSPMVDVRNYDFKSITDKTVKP